MLDVESNSKETRFAIRDTGHGIEKDDLPHIFNRYWQGKKSQKQGNGLGLSIAKEIISAHGGKIEVESEPGKGSCFTLILPKG